MINIPYYPGKLRIDFVESLNKRVQDEKYSIN